MMIASANWRILFVYCLLILLDAILSFFKPKIKLETKKDQKV